MIEKSKPYPHYVVTFRSVNEDDEQEEYHVFNSLEDVVSYVNRLILKSEKHLWDMKSITKEINAEVVAYYYIERLDSGDLTVIKHEPEKYGKMVLRPSHKLTEQELKDFMRGGT